MCWDRIAYFKKNHQSRTPNSTASGMSPDLGLLNWSPSVTLVGAALTEPRAAYWGITYWFLDFQFSYEEIDNRSTRIHAISKPCQQTKKPRTDLHVVAHNTNEVYKGTVSRLARDSSPRSITSELHFQQTPPPLRQCSYIQNGLLHLYRHCGHCCHRCHRGSRH
jgi:hypothetical protein